ncbi:MAG: phosphoglucomutase [Bacillota bacterium]|nr:MAG: phosphoglucomutase [Bacillota bacterium]
MYSEIYKEWLESGKLSKEEKAELAAIRDDEKEIEYRFGKELEFGTAGMRGILGMGTNMMNVYTVQRATQGLADYVKSSGRAAMKRGVVIAFDTRKNSRLFANAAADVLATNGVKTYLFGEVHPVPMLSFAVRRFKAAAGVMITASHNPKEYNGYKVYGADGAQMSPEDTEKVVLRISEIASCFSNKIKSGAPEKGMLKTVGKSTDKAYYKTIGKLALSPAAVKKVGREIKLVYTPVHGSGYIPVTAILKKLGIKATLVEEQTAPDEAFSTVRVPNPEFKETLAAGIRLADKIKADVVFGTDPDCDRLGVAVRDGKGEFVALSGNQAGVLMLDYVLGRLKEKNALPENGFVAKSFVTTSMAKAIADDYGVELVDVPVGFKFIGEKIKQFDDSGEKKFLFGFEESCGYLRGTHCRDKDAVVASMLFAEMVCYYTAKGVGVYQRLCDLYDKYGYCLDKNVSYNFGGIDAMKDMRAIVEGLKTKPIDKIDIYNVVAMRDYSKPARITESGEEPLDIPKNDSVYYELENGSFICVRPSGTEPKLKIYFSVKLKDFASSEKAFEKLSAAMESIIGL